LAGLFVVMRTRALQGDRSHRGTRACAHDQAQARRWLDALVTRKLAAELGGDISHMTVARIWAKHGIKPHRLEGYLASNDPDFETKAADVIGCTSPAAARGGVQRGREDAIQALDRKDPVLPLSPGRAERHGFEYFRHGTLSLYAAFNTKTGEVLGKTALGHLGGVRCLPQ